MSLHNPLEQRLTDIPVREQHLMVCGSETRVWHYGPETADHTIFLVHGFRGTHHGLLSLVAAMPDVRFIAPDLPGFGDSSPLPRPHTLDAYAEWLQDALIQLDPAGTAIVLGHSFGSLIVARQVQRLRDRRIVLVNPISENALSGPERIGTAIAVGYYRLGAVLSAPLGQALLSSSLITRIMSEVMVTTRSPALRRWIHDQHHRYFSRFTGREVLLEAFQASVSDAVSAHAADFPPGTQLVVGECDAIAPLAASRRLHEAMPDSQLHIVGGVGHLIHYEAPLALARILREWLD